MNQGLYRLSLFKFSSRNSFIQNLKPCVLEFDPQVEEAQDFKYIIITLKETLLDQIPSEPVHLVRGSPKCKYHMNILEDFIAKELRGDKVQYDARCTHGGGRVRVNTPSIQVYGFSQAFGRANHRVAAEIIKKVYPQFEVSYEQNMAQ
ncbi:hypothetical protein FGO68_gene5571 [Halteria grandinella]|uniref:Uncharacterized protein n=1 Tax=Halteria grandinella TaxID=5974 RepID=A0A8J8NQR4_HALGN|nr:hypothetical protein FGO68_gene5571 [Halteria grandinella]